MKKLLVVFVSMLVSSTVYAAGTATGEISNINIKDTGDVIVTYKLAHANPDNCSQVSQAVYKQDHLVKEEMLSAALTALAAQKTVDIWVSGCETINGATYPIAKTIKVYAQ